MDRLALGTLLLAVACRSPKPPPEPTRAPEDIEARVDQIKARLLVECSEGDESACRRVAEKPDASQAPVDPRSELVPCTASECGTMESPDGSVTYYELDADGAPLRPTAVKQWWCFDAEIVAHGTGQVLAQFGQCFQRPGVCGQEIALAAHGRGSKGWTRTSQTCHTSKKAACTFGTHVLEDTRIPACWSNFAACEDFRASVTDTNDPSHGNLTDLSPCEALLPWEWR
jgi:hypothetical protein